MHRGAKGKTCGHPATVVEQEGSVLKVREVGHEQAEEDNMEHEDFLTYHSAYGGEWF